MNMTGFQPQVAEASDAEANSESHLSDWLLAVGIVVIASLACRKLHVVAEPPGLSSWLLAVGGMLLGIVVIGIFRNLRVAWLWTGPPIKDAAVAGDAERVRALINAGVSVNQRSWSGATALHAASLNGHTECVELLLGADADIECVSRGLSRGLSSLYYACMQGQSECVRLLLSAGASVDRECQDGSTPLYIACQRGYAECARLVLEAKAAVDHVMPIGRAIPISYRIMMGRAAKALYSREGKTPLIAACDYGHDDCARLLLRAGAAADHASQYGSTALFTACCENHIECVRLLLEAHASPNLAHAEPSLRQQSFARNLRPGLPAHRLLAGATPLLCACDAGHTECARLLLEANAAVDQPRHHDSVTPMYLACASAHSECAQLLSSYVASRAWEIDGTSTTAVDLCDLEEEGHEELRAWLNLSSGWTPLHHLEVLTPARARALIRSGANPHALPALDRVTNPVIINPLLQLLRDAATGVTATGVIGRALLRILQGTDLPTPVERAESMAEPRSEVAQMLLRAADRSWSPHTHDLFPRAARVRAVELLWLGRELSTRFAGHGQALMDVWLWLIMPQAIGRGEDQEQDAPSRDGERAVAPARMP